MSSIPLVAIGKVCLTIQRSAPGTYVGGRYVEATPTQITLWANVQPASPNDMKLLAEGERNAQTLKLYTKTPIRMRWEGPNGWAADEFEWTECSGEVATYEIMHVDSYRMNHLDHWKGIAKRKPTV